MTNLLFTILIFNGFAGKIQGFVYDEDTKEPITNANVIILNTEIGTATDDNGYFYILNVPPGMYKIEISYLGYQTKRIEDVIVEIDQTTRLKVSLKPTPIEIEPITVTSKRPVVTKDMVGTTYIIRKAEITYLPIDYATYLVALQPSVARFDTAIHVRGGRATEVQYMIDNVSIIDPQTGDPAITLSKGIIDEIIFLPGGFDVKYGRAMSGVINMITTRPSEDLQFQVYGKTETIMPFYYDFGYQTYLSSIHLPVTKKVRGYISLDIMHTDDWNPRLYILPHKHRDDYSFYGKWLFAPSGKLRLSLSGAKSRSQFDRYNVWYKFYLDHFRSDLKKGNLQALNLSYMPDSKKLIHLTLSRLYTRMEYGVRDEGPYGIFEDFNFRHYFTLEYPRGGFNNPFGAYLPWKPIVNGDYPEYENKSSQVLKANLNTTLQVHKYHEVTAGIEYTYQDLQNFNYWLSTDTANPIIDEWQYNPVEFSAYLQDNIDFEGLYAKIGCRYDYFSSDIKNIEPKSILSPRIGFTFLVTEKFLFRANVGQYTQPPSYDYMYRYYHLLPFPSYMFYLFTAYGGIVGNPDLGPEKTISYEIGLQGEIRKNINLTVNTFYKDINDLVGVRWFSAVQSSTGYISYFNVEHANARGMETILDFTNPLLDVKISYTLSWARGSSSYATEVYDRYYAEEFDTTATIPSQEYYLDFDQRHRIFVQGTINLPYQTKLFVFGFLGNGFPYTPPGPEGKYGEINVTQFPFSKQIDCVLSKSFRIGHLNLNVDLEIINLLDERNQIALHGPYFPLEGIHPWEFTDYRTITGINYHPGADLNHDGIITPYEEYLSYRDLIKETDDWINAYTAPRRARIGMSINF